MTSPGTAVIVLFLIVLTAGSVWADTVNLSTGFDAAGNLIAQDLGCDAHWVEVSGPQQACPGTQVVGPTDPDWFSGWLANDANSQWVTSSASLTTNGSPVPVYEVAFYIADTAGASLTGSWGVDDRGSLSLNGQQIGLLYGGNWTGLTPISADADSYLVAGWNTLTFTMLHSDNYLEAFRFYGSVTGTDAMVDPTPEPATISLVGAGLALAGVWQHRLIGCLRGPSRFGNEPRS